jgi:hypothetical protein
MNRETDIRNIRNTESEKSTKEMEKEAKVSTKLLTSTIVSSRVHTWQSSINMAEFAPQTPLFVIQRRNPSIVMALPKA